MNLIVMKPLPHNPWTVHCTSLAMRNIRIKVKVEWTIAAIAFIFPWRKEEPQCRTLSKTWKSDSFEETELLKKMNKINHSFLNWKKHFWRKILWIHMVMPQFRQPACQNQAESSSCTCFRWVHYLAHSLFLKMWKRSGKFCLNACLHRLEGKWNEGRFGNFAKLAVWWQTKTFSLTLLSQPIFMHVSLFFVWDTWITKDWRRKVKRDSHMLAVLCTFFISWDCSGPFVLHAFRQKYLLYCHVQTLVPFT